MRRVSRNLGLHENGTYYLDIKRHGRLIRRSLDTKNRREAKRRLKAELAKLNAQRTIAKDDAVLNLRRPKPTYFIARTPTPPHNENRIHRCA
jgi:hypothetical protein